MGLKQILNSGKKCVSLLSRVRSVPAALKKHLPWKSGNSEHLSLRLELNRRILYEINDPSPSDTITIGRSSDCVWVIPQEDNVASGHHAVILMRKGHLCLRDTGSRNGIFCKGRKIQEKNLAPGDQFSIGNCTLCVERVNPIRNARHELVYLNTEQKGKSVILDRPRFVVGSAPSCDLVIDEQLVSQRHTEFATRADGCWLKDLNSKNGTFVNGTKLSSNTERLLVDDDVVSISFVDFKFVDGKVEHSKVRIWYSLGVVAVTIFVVLALNWLWMGMQSSSDTCLNRAREEAAAGRFAEAREALKESRTRRGGFLPWLVVLTLAGLVLRIAVCWELAGEKGGLNSVWMPPSSTDRPAKDSCVSTEKPQDGWPWKSLPVPSSMCFLRRMRCHMPWPNSRQASANSMKKTDYAKKPPDMRKIG